MAADDRSGLLVRMVVAVIVALVPVIALAVSPWAALTGALVLGMLPTLSSVAAGPRAMLAAAGTSAAVAVLAVVATASGEWVPLVGTLLVAFLGFGAGSLSTRGLHPAGASTIALAAYLLVDPGQVVHALDERGPLVTAALLLAALIVVGCLWAVATVAVILRGVALPNAPVIATLPYGLLLGLLSGAFTLVCLVWFPGTNAWWAVMTVGVILQPTREQTGDRLGGRILGTIVGGTAAALLAGIVPWRGVSVAVAVAFALAGVLLMLAGVKYWVSAAATTISVVLLTFERDAVLAGDLQRIVITLIAAAATALVVWAVTRVARASIHVE